MNEPTTKMTVAVPKHMPAVPPKTWAVGAEPSAAPAAKQEIAQAKKARGPARPMRDLKIPCGPQEFPLIKAALKHPSAAFLLDFYAALKNFENGLEGTSANSSGQPDNA